MEFTVTYYFDRVWLFLDPGCQEEYFQEDVSVHNPAARGLRTQPPTPEGKNLLLRLHCIHPGKCCHWQPLSV